VKKNILFRALPLLCLAPFVFAQSQAPASAPYILGPDDQVVIRALDAEEIGLTPIRIDSRGFINLPTVGRIKAAGMTSEELEAEIETRLKKYINKPDVSVYIAEMRTQPVSVIGAVQVPGVQRMQGQKTLFEALSAAGGLRADAGYLVKITRKLEWGRIPLPDAKDDPTGQFSIASVNVKNIMDASNPKDNIQIKPDDVISVPKGEIIYVIGSVKKPGGFVLGEHESLSGLQILALAEGLDRFAKPEHAKIMRPIPNSEKRQEIPVDLKQILSGKITDIALRSDDILFVPNSPKKAAMARTIETAIQLGTLTVYRIP
jgi:polysaccharide export outer membrane protein